ncbi:acetyl/propionyl/methylcrotonyl-CoA carboxylase subunit alpha [Nocardioides cheoyonin]|uniref:acetyl/propionyl/methylcrotonyl-CoA carboxylase subunit alpha n=1 Tax=Nocardioides cheoyonin TaxID=3156615 RepID=UPI0032B4A8A3
MTITRLLVANRGEIASRVFRTCRRLGIETVAVHSDADACLPYVREADHAVRLPGDAPAESYLRADLLVEAAERAGADAVHPGYGFLSESAEFARAVEAAGLTWIGPAPGSIEAMGSKIEAKAIMKRAGVPVLEAPPDPTEADLPLLVKASAGGGGRGMRVVRVLADLEPEIAAAKAEAASAFGDGTVFVEPYVEHSRHVEVQVVGDGHGGVLVLGERDCSTQRRHQKVVEESPAPLLPDATRTALHDAARRAAAAIGYRGAGTVEFLYDPEGDRFWFLEMNTRLQVEHPVTEAVFGVDLVELQLAVAERGVMPDVSHGSPLASQGHAIEVRLYAEDPAAGYQPQSGTLAAFEISTGSITEAGAGIRVDAGYETGSEVSTFYDAMLAKVIAHAPSREQAVRMLAATLRRARIHGVVTNRDQLVRILGSEEFRAGAVSTDLLADGSLAVAEGPADPAAPRAAAIALAETTRRPGFPVAWRNVTSQPQRTRFEGDVVVEWYGTRTGYRVEGNDVIAVVPTGSTDEWRVTLETDGVRTTYDVAIRGRRGAETVDVDSPLGHTALRRVPRFTDPAEATKPGSLLAPMPGTVVAVHAEPGADVTAGQALVVLEAMKMQHTVSAPTDGVLTQVDVRPGIQVAAGEVLAVVSTGTGSTDEGEA